MKCVIDNCKNESWQGKFYGNLCMPCFQFISDELRHLDDPNKVPCSQAAKNRVKEVKLLLMNAELQTVKDKWS